MEFFKPAARLDAHHLPPRAVALEALNRIEFAHRDDRAAVVADRLGHRHHPPHHAHRAGEPGRIPHHGLNVGYADRLDVDGRPRFPAPPPVVVDVPFGFEQSLERACDGIGGWGRHGGSDFIGRAPLACHRGPGHEAGDGERRPAQHAPPRGSRVAHPLGFAWLIHASVSLFQGPGSGRPGENCLPAAHRVSASSAPGSAR